MISAREKGFFQILVFLQILVVSVVYWISCLLVFVCFHGELPFLYSYSKYWMVLVAAMIFEALTRPSSLRPTPGRMKRLASVVSRRQWIWIFASLTILLVFSRDQRISRIFLGVMATSGWVALYVCNRYMVRWFADACSKKFSVFVSGHLCWGRGNGVNQSCRKSRRSIPCWKW